LNYYVAWLGVKKNWESQVCAVQVSTSLRLRFDQVFFEPSRNYKRSLEPLPLMEYQWRQQRNNYKYGYGKGTKSIEANSHTTANSSGGSPALSPSIHKMQRGYSLPEGRGILPER
jgi:hypothetical protein